MKLRDLNPRWVAIGRWDTPDGTQHYYDVPPRVGGVGFECPVHSKLCNACGQFLPQSHRLVVWFANPIDGLPHQVTDHLWQRSGETFEDLTLTPSINASEYVDKETGTICWHGHISAGEII